MLFFWLYDGSQHNPEETSGLQIFRKGTRFPQATETQWILEMDKTFSEEEIPKDTVHCVSVTDQLWDLGWIVQSPCALVFPDVKMGKMIGLSVCVCVCVCVCVRERERERERQTDRPRAGRRDETGHIQGGVAVDSRKATHPHHTHRPLFRIV